MHQLEGGDSEDLAGEKRFKDTDPATELVASDMNALHISALRMVTESGLVLKADGAADLADDWMQLVRASRRLGRQDEWFAVPMSAASVNLSTDRDKHLFNITGAEPDGNVVLPDDTDAHDGRVIVIRNDSTTAKNIVSFSISYRLMPGCAIALIATLNGTDDVEWLALDGSRAGSFTMDLEAVAGPTIVTTGTAYWSRQGNTIHLQIPQLIGAISGGPQELFLTGPSLSDLPSDIMPPITAATRNIHTAVVQDNGTKVMGYLELSNGGSGWRIRILLMGTNLFANGSAGILAQNISFLIP